MKHDPAIQRRHTVRKIRSLIEPYIPTLKLWYVFVRIWLAGLRKGRWQNGWGVTIDWPFGKYNEQIDWLIPFLEKHLKDTHNVFGPASVTGGAKVIFFCPKLLGPKNLGPFRETLS